jgi:DNA-binding GntR family transcriptional regulator
MSQPAHSSLSPLGAPRVLTEDVYSVVKDAILRMEFEAGSRLVEVDLADRLGVSKSPVREALLRLAGEGLVVQTPFRGCVVTVPDKNEVDEIYELREELEAMAVRLATPRLTSAVIATARGLLADALEAIERDDRPLLAERNSQFHITFVANSGNRQLYRVLANLQDKVRLSSMLGWRAAATMGTEHGQHSSVLNAAELGDAELAARLMREHIHSFRMRYRREKPE